MSVPHKFSKKNNGDPRHVPIVTSFMSSMIFLLCHVHARDHARAGFRQATGSEERHPDQWRIVALLRHVAGRNSEGDQDFNTDSLRARSSRVGL